MCVDIWHLYLVVVGLFFLFFSLTKWFCLFIYICYIYYVLTSDFFFLILISVIKKKAIFELAYIVTNIFFFSLSIFLKLKCSLRSLCKATSVRGMFSVCISTLVHIVLVCNLNAVQTRCCSPQSVSLQAGRPVHCADMDSWSCWYSLLLRLTPGHRDTCSLMYSLYLSAFSQIGGRKRGREPNGDCALCFQPL